MTKSISLIYPFTPRVIGVAENDIAAVHDNSIVSAFRIFQDSGWKSSICYLTNGSRYYSVSYRQIRYNFYPISRWLTKYVSRQKTDPHFGTEWSLFLVFYTLFFGSDITCFFISVGWFTKLLALCNYIRRRPYVVIVGGWGIPRGRSQRWFFEKARRVLVHTEGHRQWLHANRGIPLDKMEVFPIGINMLLYQEKPVPLSLDDGRPHLLYVGRLMPNKGLFEALEALVEIRRAVPEVTMTVVGPWGDDNFKDKVEQFIQEKNLEDVVIFEGVIENRELPKFYQKADLLLFPSRSESFGIVVVESMACGTPVVAIRGSGGPDEIIEHNETGLLVNPPDIAVSSIELLQDQNRLMMMSKAARRKVERCYSSEQTYLQLKNIFDLI